MQESYLKTLQKQLRGASWFNSLLQQVVTIQKLQKIFQHTVDPDLAEHCRVSHLHKNSLFLTAENNMWSARVRYCTPDLVRALKAYPEFAGLTDIRCRLETHFDFNSYLERKLPELSANSTDLIRKTASATANPQLRSALLKLAEVKPRPKPARA